MTDSSTYYSGGPKTQSHEEYVEAIVSILNFHSIDLADDEDVAKKLVAEVAERKGADGFKLIRITIETYDPNAPAHDNL